MFRPISNLVFEMVPEEKGSISKDDALILSRMLQLKNKIFEANELLNELMKKPFIRPVFSKDCIVN